MRKLFGIVVIASIASIAGASGEGVTTTTRSSSNGWEVLEWHWTSNASGLCAVTTQAMEVVGRAERLTTIPSSQDTTSPTLNYDIVIYDKDGFDILGGVGANRSNSAIESVSSKISDGTATRPMPVYGRLYPAISNAGASKKGVIKLYVRP